MATPPISQRSCGDCALCCHLGEIPDVKAFNAWCTHCSSQQRCDIYETRPRPCRDFHCHYLLSDLGEEWYPRDCGFIVATYQHPPRVTIMADPAMPARWRESPYIEQIQHWARKGAVTVQTGPRTYAISPQSIDDLGEDSDETMIVILEQETPAGMRYRAIRTPRQA